MEKCFYFYIIIISIFKGLGIESDNKIYLLSYGLACIVLLYKIINDKFTKKEITVMAVIIIIGILDFILGKTTTFLFLAITLCGLKNVDLKKTIKIVLIVRIVTFTLMVILSIIGIIPANDIEFYRNGEFITRHSLGYDYPNTTHLSFAIIIALFVYVFWNKIKLQHILLLEVINIGMYFLTYSRTGFIVITTLMIIVIIFKYLKKLQNIMAFIFKYLYWIMFAITLISAIGYSHIEILNTINEIFTGRIEYMNKLIMNFPIPIIGKEIYNSYANIDNGYISMLYQGGLIAFAFISYYMTRISNNFYKEKKYKELILISFFIINAFTESFFMSISMNISLIFFATELFKEERIENGKANNIHTNVQSKK